MGEADLTEEDKRYLEFGNRFEEEFVNQGLYDRRTMDQTLDLAEKLLKILED